MIRRALVPDELPGGYKVNAGQDIMISVYNVHHSSEVLLDVFKCKKLFFYWSNAASLFECSKQYTFVKKVGDGIFKSL